MGNMLTVNEAAEKIGVSVDTIRRWEKKGLIKAKRGKNNYRFFNLSEVQRQHNKITGSSKSSNSYKILKARNTRYKAIDLFAGAGGTALGLENAGFEHVMLNEFEK